MVVVKKRISSRFFAHINGKVSNPPPGTIVDSEVTRPEWCVSYLFSASCLYLVIVVVSCCNLCQVWLLHREPGCPHWKRLPNPLQCCVWHQWTEAWSYAASYLQTVPHVLQLAGRLALNSFVNKCFLMDGWTHMVSSHSWRNLMIWTLSVIVFKHLSVQKCWLQPVFLTFKKE